MTIASILFDEFCSKNSRKTKNFSKIKIKSQKHCVREVVEIVGVNYVFSDDSIIFINKAGDDACVINLDDHLKRLNYRVIGLKKKKRKTFLCTLTQEVYAI